MFETKLAGDLNARTETEAPNRKKSDAPVIGAGELHLPDDDAIILTDGGQSLGRVIADNRELVAAGLLDAANQYAGHAEHDEGPGWDDVETLVHIAERIDRRGR